MALVPYVLMAATAVLQVQGYLAHRKATRS
jgi:hypothetical protein